MLNNKRTNINILKGLALVIIVAIMIFLFTLFSDDDFSLTYVNLMVNPNIEFGIDDNEVVVSVVALNDDANIVLHELELEGLEYEEALELVVDELVELEYVNDNEILISIESEDEEKIESVRERTINKVRDRLEEKEKYAVINYLEVGQELKIEAEELGVTVGHMIAVERASVVLDDVSKEELYDLSLGEIKRMVADQRTSDLRPNVDELREERIEMARERREQIEQRQQEAREAREEALEQPSTDVEERETRIPDVVPRNLDEVREADRNAIDLRERPVRVE